MRTLSNESILLVSETDDDDMIFVMIFCSSKSVLNLTTCSFSLLTRTQQRSSISLFTTSLFLVLASQFFEGGPFVGGFRFFWVLLVKLVGRTHLPMIHRLIRNLYPLHFAFPRTQYKIHIIRRFSFTTRFFEYFVTQKKVFEMDYEFDYN